MKKVLFYLLLLQISVIAGFAEEYKDPATNVIYIYDPAGNTAEVKEGYEWDEDCECAEGDQPGSPDAKDEIIILDKITVNGKEYIVDKISFCAFISMENIKSVVIPSSVKSIEYGAFLHCKSLSNVVLSQGLNSIGYVAFAGCSSLKQLSLPEGLKRIGGGALSFCGMSDITIPSSVESIADMQAFYSPALKTITSLIKDPFEVYEYFNQDLRNVTLRVPAGTKSKYETTTGWRVIKNIEEFQPTLEENETSFTKDQMATIILPTAPDAGKGKYYRLDRVEDGQIIFEQELLPRACVPYIIMPSEDFSIDLGTLDLEDLSQDAVSVDGISFIGSYHRKEFEHEEGYYIDIIDRTPDCLDEWAKPGKAIVGALRAYLTWDDPIDHGGAKNPDDEMEIKLIDYETGLEEMKNEELKMTNEDAVFDLSGRQINPQSSFFNLQLRNGIYIKMGRKMAK